MKRILALTLALLMLLCLFAGCKDQPAAPTGDSQPADGSSEALPTGTAASPETTEPPAPAELAVPVPDGVAPTADNARVFYEIFVGSFSDSDGDGVGDLRGIINRMDYLNDGDPNSGLSLGIEGIWLTPIFKSPSYHKYDVSDYYEVDPQFGTSEDLRELIGLCHERNVKLILDLPINHTGSRNKWFSDFIVAHRQGLTDSDAYDFYSWHGPDEQGLAGHRYSEVSGTDDYYECNFDDSMPELNFDSEAVRTALLDVARYYLDMGIDGFRFDAAKYIYYGDNRISAEFWVWYLDELRKIKPDLYTVAEVWDSDGVTDLYFPATNCFDFTISQAEGLIASTAKGKSVSAYTSYVEDYLRRVRELNPEAMIVPFIANHDTDRAAGYLSAASGEMKVAANLYILSSGSPFIYYGEEIGMRGSRGGANTDANRRLAMVWHDGDTVKNPVGSTYKSQIEQGVAEQLADESSLYNYYKKLIMIRHANPEIARGEYTAYMVPGSKVGGFFAAWNSSTVLVLHNTTDAGATVDLSELGVTELRAVIGVGDASIEGTTLKLGGQTSVVLK